MSIFETGYPQQVLINCPMISGQGGEKENVLADKSDRFVLQRGKGVRTIQTAIKERDINWRKRCGSEWCNLKSDVYPGDRFHKGRELKIVHCSGKGTSFQLKCSLAKIT